MHILIAPDAFAGTLSAPEAAEAIGAGWRRTAPGAEIDLAPMSDGGPGFVDVLHAALGGELLAVTVTGPLGDPVPATLLLAERTAYVESAQACGLHLTGGSESERAGTVGVGELIAAAVEAGAERVVVGLGGSGTTDGGAGLLAGLGAEADGPLDEGPRGLAGVTTVGMDRVRERVAGVELVAASDVESPLTGLFGAAKTFGPQKGLSEEQIGEVDHRLVRFAELVDRRLSLEPGAGAAGGAGYALLCLGAHRRPGVEVVAAAVDLAARAAAADVVITGEGSFDVSSRAGKVPYGVASVATDALRPTVVLAGQVHVGTREMRALGVDSAYSMSELIGAERAVAEPGAALAELAARVARTWSR